MSQTSTPTALEVSDAPDQPEPTPELEALYRSFEAELRVPLRTEIGDPMPAHPQADASLDESSGLPGWSRRHVVAHVHFCAEVLRRLVGWAVTGMGNPMYASPGQRVAESEHGATTSAPQLLRLVVDSADRPAEEAHMAWPPLRPGPPYQLLGSRPAQRGLHATGRRPSAEGV